MWLRARMAPEDVDEKRGLDSLQGALVCREGNADQGHSVDQEGPENRVNEWIDTFHAEERLGAQHSDPPRSLGHKLTHEWAGRLEAREKHRPSPDHKADEYATHCSVHSGVAPVKGRQHSWQKLGNTGK